MRVVSQINVLGKHHLKFLQKNWQSNSFWHCVAYNAFPCDLKIEPLAAGNTRGNKHSSTPAFTHTIKVAVCCHWGRNTARETAPQLGSAPFPWEICLHKPPHTGPDHPNTTPSWCKAGFCARFYSFIPKADPPRCARPTGWSNNSEAVGP